VPIIQSTFQNLQSGSTFILVHKFVSTQKVYAAKLKKKLFAGWIDGRKVKIQCLGMVQSGATEV
jgi:hypothetical protein